MFTNISWVDYTLVVTLLIAFYYLIVGVRYYPTELKELLSRKRKFPFRGNVARENDHSEETLPEPGIHDGDNLPVEPSVATDSGVESLIAALKENIEKASKKQYIHQEFRYSLITILKEYPKLKESTFRSGINRLIFSECQKYGTITLSEDDIVRLWNDVV